MAVARDHEPDVDLRSTGLTVRLVGDEVNGLRESDIELARQVSAAARTLGLPADPTAVQDVQVTIDALVGPEVREFWRAALGYRAVDDADLLDPHSRGPSFWFQEGNEACVASWMGRD